MLQLSPITKAALQQSQTVVALESTFIAYGMPYPQNAFLLATIN